MTQESGVQRAVKAAGSQQLLAEALGLKQQTISTWVVRGYVPLDHVTAVSAVSGVPKRELVSPKVLAATVSAELF